MASFNHSSNKYVVGKTPGEEWVHLKISNTSDEVRTAAIKAYDGETEEAFILYTGDQEINEATIESNSSVVMKVKTSETASKIALELSHNGRGAGVTVRQKSSSNAGDDSGIELILK